MYQPMLWYKYNKWLHNECISYTRQHQQWRGLIYAAMLHAAVAYTNTIEKAVIQFKTLN